MPTGYAGFSGQATGSGSRTLVIIGNGGSSTHALFTMLTTTPLPDTTVIWLDGSDINDTGDVDAVIAAGPDYMVAADSVPITRLFSPFGGDVRRPVHERPTGHRLAGRLLVDAPAGQPDVQPAAVTPVTAESRPTTDLVGGRPHVLADEHEIGGLAERDERVAGGDVRDSRPVKPPSTSPAITPSPTPPE